MDVHTLLYFFIVLCIVALILWGVMQLPLPPIFRTAVYVVIGVILLLWLLSYVGGGHAMSFH